MQSELQPLTDDARWALVTGASAGLGREFARQLAALDYHLVLVARRADRLHALASELRSEHGTACLVLPADLGQPEAVREIVAQLGRENIFVEFLVNNAGYGVPGRFTEVGWPTHREFLQVMVATVCELTWQLLPAMQERGRGHVVNVASVAGLVPGTEGHTLYGASKSFLIKLSQSLSLENRRYGVKVSALCPGFTYTEFHDVAGTRELVGKLPDFMWQNAEEVVRFGIESVTRAKPRVVAIPGHLYPCIVWLGNTLPVLGNYLNRRVARRFRKLD